MSTHDLPTTVLSELDQEIIVLTFPSVARLLELDPNAALLYLFYCKTAKHQARQIGYTNKIKATSDFCRNGLHWGSEKFHRVKKILVENGFVVDIVRRSDHGAVQENYIQINFLLNPHKEPKASYNPLPSNEGTPLPSFEGTSHFPRSREPVNEGTNADNKNRNAVNENIASNTPESYSNISPVISKKANEQVLSSISTESHSNSSLTAETAVPLTDDQLYEIADRKNVTFGNVRSIHQQVLEMIADGNKYKAKTVDRTLAKWIDLALQRGNIQPMGEVERMVFELRSPQKSRDLAALIGRMKEDGML